MSELTPSTPLPANEAEVVARLKIRPKRIRVEVTYDEEQGCARHWVRLTNDFRDSLKKFGAFLYNIACDVEQAGGYVTQFSHSTASPLSPANADPNDLRPHKKWRCMFVEASIRTRVQAEANQQAWDQAIRDMAANFKRT